MLIIRCPHCGKRSASRQAVGDRKVRCPSCGEVFSPEPERVEPAKPPPSRPVTPTRKPRNWASLVTVVLLLAVAAGVAGVLAYTVAQRIRHPKEVRITGPAPRAGPPVESGPTEPPPATPPVGPEPPSAGEDFASRMVVGEFGVIDGATPDVGYVRGEVRNDSDAAAVRVVVELALEDVDGGQFKLGRVECRYIPPEESVRFSKDYWGLRARRIGKYLSRVAEVEVDRDIVCWSISDRHCERSVGDGLVTVTGRVYNETGSPVHHVKVFGDFFTRDGVRMGAGEGELRGTASLRPGESADFVVRCQLSVPASIVTAFDLRAVGRR